MATKVANDGLAGSIDLVKLSTPGTADATTYLRGDGAWSTVSSGDNTPSFRAKMSTYQTFSSGYIKIQFDTEDWDTDGAYDHSSNYRFTVPSGKAGKYFFTIGIAQKGTSAQGVNYPLVIYKNGSAIRYVSPTPTYGGNVERLRVNWSEPLDLAESDYIEVFCNGTGFEIEDGFFSGFKLNGV